MADSTCLMHGFSHHASALPNQSSIENEMHESVSLGRFMTESLSWEKWSTFSHKKYVEEAERYAQPGSVAQKKAFFDAHFKRIAAAKKAAALLDQQNAAKTMGAADNNNTNNVDEGQTEISNSHSINVDVKMEEVVIEEDGSVETEKEGGNAVISVNEVSLENLMNIHPVNQLDNLEKRDSVSASGTERPLLKQNSGGSEDVLSVTGNERSVLSSFKSPIQSRTWEVPSTPANPVTTTTNLSKENESDFAASAKNYSVDEKISSSKPLRTLMNLLEIEKQPVVSSTNKTENSVIAQKTPQDRAASTEGVVFTYPRSENKRFLSCISSFSYILRRERSAKRKQRKQKIEGKRDASEVQKMQKALKEKPGNEFRKQGCGFCFKARPSLDSYRERETPKHHKKKSAAAQPQSAALGQSISNVAQGNIPMPPPAKNLSKKILLPNQNKLLTKERIAHENASPNIQH